jgi:hypothetical protein
MKSAVEGLSEMLLPRKLLPSSSTELDIIRGYPFPATIAACWDI